MDNSRSLIQDQIEQLFWDKLVLDDGMCNNNFEVVELAKEVLEIVFGEKCVGVKK